MAIEEGEAIEPMRIRPEARIEIRRPAEVAEDRQRIVTELEDKLKRATEDVKKREKTEQLLDELRVKINDAQKVGEEAESYKTDEVEEIAEALRTMKGEEREKVEKKQPRT